MKRFWLIKRKRLSRFFNNNIKIIIDNDIISINRSHLNYLIYTIIVSKKRRIHSIPPNHHSSSLARSSPLSIHNHSNFINRSSNILSFHTARLFISFAFRSACDLSYIPFYFLPSSCSLTKELNYNDLYNQRLRYAFLFFT